MSTAPNAAAAAAAAENRKANTQAKRSPMNDSAVHVLKGAIVSVLGAKCAVTQSYDFDHALKGEISVSYEGETISQEEFQSIENKCNQYIQENIPFQNLVLDRAAAESKYQSAPVNHTFIYDVTPPADSETKLNIVEVAGCTVNCCAGPHVASTGELKLMKLVKMRNRKNQKAYEFSFVVEKAAEEVIARNAAAAAALNSKKTTAQQQAAVASSLGADKKKGKDAPAAAAAAAPAASSKAASSAAAAKPARKDYVVETTENIFNDLIIPAFAELQSASAASVTPAATAAAVVPSAAAAALTPAELQSLRTQLLPRLESYLVMFANEAYTKGFTAQKQGAGNVDLARIL